MDVLITDPFVTAFDQAGDFLNLGNSFFQFIFLYVAVIDGSG